MAKMKMKENQEIVSLPCDDQAEKTLLGSILLHNKYLKDISNLKAKDFYTHSNQVIWQAVLDFKEQNPDIECSVTTLKNYLEKKELLEEVGGVLYLANLTSFDGASSYQSAEYYANIIREKANRRNIILTANKLSSMAEDLSLNPDEILTTAQEDFFKIETRNNKPFKTYSAEEKLPVFMKAFLENKENLKIKTDYKYFDLCLGGGFTKGSLVNLSGSTGTGKTTAALNFLTSFCLQGHDCLYISLEMSGEEIFAKILSCLTHRIADEKKQSLSMSNKNVLTYAQIQENEIAEGNQFTNYTEALEVFQTRIMKHLYISEGLASITPDHIQQIVQQYIQRTGRIPLVFVDYLQILAPHNEKATDKANIDFAVKKMKSIASGNALEGFKSMTSQELKTVVFCINSQNRASNGQSATESSGLGSSCLEYTADYCIACEYSCLKTTNDKEKGQQLADEEKANPIRKLDFKLIKIRRKNPARKNEMPCFMFYNGAYFRPVYVKTSKENTVATESENNIESQNQEQQSMKDFFL